MKYGSFPPSPPSLMEGLKTFMVINILVMWTDFAFAGNADRSAGNNIAFAGNADRFAGKNITIAGKTERFAGNNITFAGKPTGLREKILWISEKIYLVKKVSL